MIASRERVEYICYWLSRDRDHEVHIKHSSHTQIAFVVTINVLLLHICQDNNTLIMDTIKSSDKEKSGWVEKSFAAYRLTLYDPYDCLELFSPNLDKRTITVCKIPLE